ncbi:MAG: hypothetical protein A2W11_08895 [Ignavibacteria bacterium RBG_16_35_7]|nr:MAG: hypothetical protein A2W11_08895 [Ignavibacteria bacterium RBG_16_35_7]
MINRTKILLILLILLLLIPTTFCFAQNANNTIDNISRDRLVTDQELLRLFDYSFPGLNVVESAVKNNDTEKALELLAEYFRNRADENYFFSGKNISKEIELFQKSYPEEVESIEKRSNEFIETYGTDLAWKMPGVDKLGRPNTPNTIRYISRFPRAYENVLSAIFKKDNGSINDLMAQLRDFINDYESGKTEIGSNDVFERFYAGHRTRNLLFAYYLMLHTDNLQWEDQIFLIKVFLLHGARLIDVCKNFQYGNHQLHGLAGLYEMSIMFPELPVMNSWNDTALKIIMVHVEKEIKEDGFQFERASHYFKLDIMNYFRIFQISKVNNKKLPELLEHRFHKMFDAIVNIALPTKSLPVLQDAQAIYSTQIDSLENNNAAELADPKESFFLSIGAAVFNDPIYKFFADDILYPDLFWFFSDREKDNYYKLKLQTPTVKSISLSESKYYVMRTGWTKDDLYMVIDGGLAQFKPDHTHGGVLGVMVYGLGSELLPTYRVLYSDISYPYMKNSLVKNVALADQLLQGQNWIDNNARTGFGIWEKLPTPTVHEWITGNTYDYFSASHDRFDSIGVNYNRSIIFFKPNFWLVIDKFASKDIHSYEQLWQGEFSVLKDVNGIVKQNKKSKFYVLQSDGADMNISPYSKYGINSMMFEKEAMSNYSFNTLLCPVKNNDDSTPVIRTYENKNYKLINITNGNQQSSVYFKKDDMLNLPEIKTDAQFVCLSYESDQLKSVLLYQGSKINVNEFNLTSRIPSVIEIEKGDNGTWCDTDLKGNPQNIKLERK